MVSAVLTFDAQGDLVDFVSDDKSYSVDGNTSLKLAWSSPPCGHREFAGIRLFQRVDAVWKRPEGDFVYGEFNLDEIVYFPAASSSQRMAAR